MTVGHRRNANFLVLRSVTGLGLSSKKAAVFAHPSPPVLPPSHTFEDHVAESLWPVACCRSIYSCDLLPESSQSSQLRQPSSFSLSVTAQTRAASTFDKKHKTSILIQATSIIYHAAKLLVDIFQQDQSHSHEPSTILSCSHHPTPSRCSTAHTLLHIH